jgi:hypothetical protein
MDMPNTELNWAVFVLTAFPCYAQQKAISMRVKVLEHVNPPPGRGFIQFYFLDL